MNALTRDSLRSLRRQQELTQGVVLRDPKQKGGSGGGGSGGGSDMRRSCEPAVCLNLTGRDVAPGFAMWVERSAASVDLGQAFPLPTDGERDGLIEVVHTDTTIFSSDPQNVDLSSLGLEGNDLVLVTSTYNAGNNDAIDTTFYGSFAYAPTLSSPGSNRPRIAGFWYDEIPSGVLPLNPPGAGSHNGILVVLRGVKRWETDGETLTPGKVHGVIANGLPSFYYAFADSHQSYQDAGAMARVTTATYSKRGGDVHAILDLDLDTSGNADDYVFPVGTRFLLVYQPYSGISGSWVLSRPGGLFPPADLIGSATGHGTTTFLGAYLTEPLTEPSPADPDAWLAKLADKDLADGRDTMSVIPIIPYAADEDTPAVYPSLPCDPLIATPYLHAASIKEDSAAGRKAAREKLADNRARDLVIAMESKAHGQPVTVSRRGGYGCYAWVFVRDPSHMWAGPPVENAWREVIYDEPIGDEVGKLGRFERNKIAKQAALTSEGEIDPRTECFIGRGDILVSRSTPGPFEIKAKGRLPTQTEAQEIEVTVKAKRTSFTLGVISGEWTQWLLDTGADETLTDDMWSYAQAVVSLPEDGSEPGGFVDRVSLSDLAIDLATDSLAVDPPKYGVPGVLMQYVTSDNGYYKGILLDSRFLYVRPVYNVWSGEEIENDEEIEDTFTFAGGELGGFVQPGYAPVVVCNPETEEFGEVGVDVDYASWPEAYPKPPSIVPTGTDVEDLPEGYDPTIGRVPGTVSGKEGEDSGRGLMLCFGYITGWPSDDDGCC